MSSISIDGNGEALGDYTGEIPFIITLTDKLKGFKTNEASPTDTVYIFYDPRCPVCNEAFDKIELLDLKSRNIAVKWLPTTSLPSSNAAELEDAQKLAVVAMQTQDPKEFKASMKGAKRADSVSDLEIEYLSDNAQVLAAATYEVPAYGKGYKIKVPAALYMNKETGLPKLLFGVPDDRVLKTIFGE